MGDTQPRRLEERLARELLLILALTAVALVQTTLLPAPLGAPPALLLILVVCRVLVVPEGAPGIGLTAALRWAFYGGLALDLLAGSLLGSHGLALLLAALLAALLVRDTSVGGLLLPLLALVLAAVVYELTLALLAMPGALFADWQTYLLLVLLPSVLLALIPAPLALWALRRADQRLLGR